MFWLCQRATAPLHWSPFQPGNPLPAVTSLATNQARAQARPNDSFKPNLLRSGKHMAGAACHVFASTTQVGLTQVLGTRSMSSQRALAGVAHDIAHHAGSGLSYVHPHLYPVCKAAGLREATIDLLAEAPYPLGLPQAEPLRLSLIALRNKFFAILSANGFVPSDVAAVSLRFQFPLLGADGYTCQVGARLQSSHGRPVVGGKSGA
jgi:hypothetical protein